MTFFEEGVTRSSIRADFLAFSSLASGARLADGLRMSTVYGESPYAQPADLGRLLRVVRGEILVVGGQARRGGLAGVLRVLVPLVEAEPVVLARERVGVLRRVATEAELLEDPQVE